MFDPECYEQRFVEEQSYWAQMLRDHEDAERHMAPHPEAELVCLLTYRATRPADKPLPSGRLLQPLDPDLEAMPF